MSSFAEGIDTLAGAGKAVIGGAADDIVEIVKMTIEAERSVSFRSSSPTGRLSRGAAAGGFPRLRAVPRLFRVSP